MDNGPSLYDDDIVTWAEQQVTALRALAARGDLSNVVDWENVIEEIESVGRSQIQGVESLLLQVLVHVLKYLSAPSAQSTGSWRVEVVAFQRAARRNYKRAMQERIDWQALWQDALANADVQLKVYGDRLIGGLPKTFPFEPEQLVAPDFDMDTALERLAAVLKSNADRH
ncbi:DUF29 domain-containing protein [Methylobacterium pseudosasicola]|uniref:DUF29 domain-containing protein n=1 Tax=Methylobacterium pseudosasicola TaxID=582667 RepID=A0A1I4I184_9HYPH|nr:DUF29 domain-containing protein [Methylobacterium pseudosasicola]SFL47723.1 protein of unknown function DUF29 [Methylobacterium pseudosasicola]